jgi:hypothetical protein
MTTTPATLVSMSHTLEVTGVDMLVTTQIEQDPNNGDYVRDVRVLDGDGNIVVQVRCRSLTRDKLNLTAPIQLF